MAADTEVIAALTALAAVTIGPFVTWHVGKKQIAAQVISSNRQAWINDLRDTLAAFVKNALSLKPAYASGTISQPDAYARFEEMVLARHKIELMLNPREAEHQELLRLMASIVDHVREALRCIFEGTDPGNDNERLTAVSALIPVAQTILKSEQELGTDHGFLFLIRKIGGFPFARLGLRALRLLDPRFRQCPAASLRCRRRPPVRRREPDALRHRAGTCRF